jgi:hypothetical protein
MIITSLPWEHTKFGDKVYSFGKEQTPCLTSDGKCHLDGPAFGGFVLMNSYLEMQKYNIRKFSLPQDDMVNQLLRIYEDKMIDNQGSIDAIQCISAMIIQS